MHGYDYGGPPPPPGPPCSDGMPMGMYPPPPGPPMPPHGMMEGIPVGGPMDDPHSHMLSQSGAPIGFDDVTAPVSSQTSVSADYTLTSLDVTPSPGPGLPPNESVENLATV